MKKIIIIAFSVLIAVTMSSFAIEKQTQLYNQDVARKGCNKPLGFFPTPAKLTCMLSAIGKTEKEVQPRVLAIIFTTCHGETLQPLPAGVTAKKYPTLGACLKDPAAIAIINNELKAKNFPLLKIMNTDILSPAAASNI